MYITNHAALTNSAAAILVGHKKVFWSLKYNSVDLMQYNKRADRMMTEKGQKWAAVFSLTWRFLFNFTLSFCFIFLLPFETGPKWFLPWLPIKCQKTLPNHFPGGKFAPTNKLYSLTKWNLKRKAQNKFHSLTKLD